MTEPGHKVEMTVGNVLNKMASGLVFAVVLHEKDGGRILPVMVGLSEAQAIVIRSRELKMPRPHVYDLFMTTLGQLGTRLEEVYIYSLNAGVFHSYLILEKEDGTRIEVDSRTSDAIALAVHRDIPIYIDEELLDSCCAREESPGAYSMPISTVSEDVLQQAMENAVESENYELAAKLRDEINKRKDV